MRAMVATLALSGVLAAGIGIVATTAVAQDGDEPETSAPTGTGDEALVDRLIELERELPALPPADIVLDPGTTWGDIEGDFLGAFTELDLLADDARMLFIDADDADGAVADAVSDVARSYLRLREAYEDLASYEDFDLSRPLATRDGDGVATGADEARGFVEVAVPLLVEARGDALVGYAVLRDSEAADDSEKGLFDAAFRDTEAFMSSLRPDLARLVSASTTSVLVAVERFVPDSSEAHAKSVLYVCVPREEYPATAPSPLAALADLLANGAELQETADCPDLDNDNEVTVSAG